MDQKEQKKIIGEKGAMKVPGKVTIDWAKTKDDFMYSDMNGEWIITTNNELIMLSPYQELPKGVNIKKRFLVFSLAAYHTTDWLRSFCNKHHPDIDFDTELETDEPGVFARYQEKFGYDYEEGARELQYEALKKELAARGYEMPWED